MNAKHPSSLALALALALTLLGTRAHSQTVRYKGAGPKLWTAAQVDSLIQVKNEKVKSLGIVFTKQVRKTVTRADTTIYEYTLQGATAGVAENRAKYAAFVSKPLPAFVLPDLAGRTVDSKQLLGKPVVLNLWFTSCAPCIAEMPALNRIQAEQANAGVVFLALTYESKEKVQAFLAKRPFTFRHVAGAKSFCDQLTTGYPLSIFVGKDGIIKSILEGMPLIFDPVTKQPSGVVNDQDFYVALEQIK